MKKSIILLAVATALTATSCKEKKSYADLLTDETHAVNLFLSNNKVENKIPADNKFLTGEDAPYYRIDEDGMLYMQVINPGTSGNMATDDELIYFRFTRYNLNIYLSTGQLVGEGNSNDLTFNATSFRFQNVQLSSASNFGMGIQEPLKYLPIDCEVNLVVKSQLGPSSEIANVVPYLYNLRYFKSPL